MEILQCNQIYILQCSEMGLGAFFCQRPLSCFCIRLYIRRRKDKGKLEGSDYAVSLKRVLKQICSWKNMFLQKNSTSEFHDQFPPCPKVKKYTEAKTHCTCKRMSCQQVLSRQVLAPSRGSLRKRITLSD